MNPSYTMTETQVTVVLDGQVYQAQEGQPHFAALRDAVFKGEWEKVPSLGTTKSLLEQWSREGFRATGEQLFYKGEAVDEVIAKRIIQAILAGEDAERHLRFIEKLDENPSFMARTTLPAFLNRTGIPLSEEGNILAYKGVSQNLRDVHSGQFDNSPGCTLTMQRNRVSDDPNHLCHFGFHVGSREYASSFGPRVVVVEVDPSKVVCVPADHNGAKMRCCEYKVIGFDNGAPLNDHHFDATDVPNVDDEDDFDDIDIDDEEDHKIAARYYGDYDDDPDIEPVDERATVHTDGTPLQEGETSPVPKDQPAAVQIPRTPNHPFNKLNSLELTQCSIGDLRTYASRELLIVGASKLPGGKLTLVPKIVDTRRYNELRDAPEFVRDAFA